MSFNNSTLSGLLNNINSEKNRYITILYKLKRFISLNEHNKYVLVKNQTDKLLITQNLQLIYENVKFNHPIIKIFYEFLLKTDECVNGAKYFIKTIQLIMDDIIELLDNGISAKEISNGLRDLKFTLKLCPKTFSACEVLKMIIDENLNNAHVVNLLIKAIEETGSCDTEKIRIIKINAGVLNDSEVIDGFVVPNLPSTSVQTCDNPLVNIYNCSLDIERPELKGTVLLQNADELLNYSKDEIYKIKKIVDNIKSDAILVNGSVNDTFLDFCNMRNILVLKIFNKYDLIRISRMAEIPIHSDITLQSNSKKIKKIETFNKGNKNFTKLISDSTIKTIILKHPIVEILDEYEMTINKILTGLNDKIIDVQLGNIQIDGETIVEKTIAKRIDSNNIVMLNKDKKRCFRYSLEFISTILEINDYLLSQKDQIQLGSPPKSGIDEYN